MARYHLAVTLSEGLQEAIATRYMQGAAIRALVDEFGVSHPVIYRIVVQRGLPRRKRLWTPEEDALLATELPGTTIAALTTRTPGAVRSRRYYLGHRPEPAGAVSGEG